MKPEAFETAGCRAGRPGFRDAAWEVGADGLSSVMKECGAVSLGQGIPFHAAVKEEKEGQEERDGLGGAGPLSQTFQGWTSCSSGLFSIPRKLCASRNLLKVTQLSEPPTNAITAPNHMPTQSF